MYGIARFRVHGVPAPPPSTDRAEAGGTRAPAASTVVLRTSLRESQQNRISPKNQPCTRTHVWRVTHTFGVDTFLVSDGESGPNGLNRGD